MYRYLVFFGEHYYPSGGMGDFKSSFNNIEVAEHYLLQVLKNESADPDHEWSTNSIEMQHNNYWGQILDTKTGEVKEFK